MTKLRTDRMLKNIARNTPDRKTVRIYGVGEQDPHNIYKRVGYQFGRMMLLKYPRGDFRIQIYQDDDLARYPGEIVYTMIARR